MAKRTATSELNHDNWDRDEEPEVAGSFTKANEEALKKRVIKVAKRRNPISSQSEEDKPSAFGGFSGFAKTTSVASPSPSTSTAFGFLSNLANKTETAKTNGTSNKVTEKSDKNLDEYYAKLKGLNESVTEWIKKHVNTNPFINLQPIFKDYDKYITDLEKLKNEVVSSKPETSNAQFNFTSTSTTSQNLPAPLKFSFSPTTSTPTSATFSFGSSATTVTVGTNSFPTTPMFSFGKPQTSTDSKFSFTSTVVKPANEGNANNTEEDQDEEPPKAEFVPVVEEGHVYTTRCKVFVKKDGNYADHGVGTLYLKPIPNSEKIQLFVRADTNLGNLICNFVLSQGIPMQRMGKKDVMLVCVPVPHAKPPPVPILLRVKSPEEADELLKNLEKHKK